MHEEREKGKEKRKKEEEKDAENKQRHLRSFPAYLMISPAATKEKKCSTETSQRGEAKEEGEEESRRRLRPTATSSCIPTTLEADSTQHPPSPSTSLTPYFIYKLHMHILLLLLLLR